MFRVILWPKSNAVTTYTQKWRSHQSPCRKHVAVYINTYCHTSCDFRLIFEHSWLYPATEWQVGDSLPSAKQCNKCTSKASRYSGAYDVIFRTTTYESRIYLRLSQWSNYNLLILILNTMISLSNSNDNNHYRLLARQHQYFAYTSSAYL